MQGESTQPDAGTALSVPSSPPATKVAGEWNPPRTFASLRHRNYRLYTAGQLTSQVGTWMQQVAQGYLVYQLTGSPLYLGLVAFCGAIPIWFFALTAGALIDRLSRRTVLLLTQSAAALLAFVLAALVFAGVVQPWHILVLAFLLGTVNAFDMTARQAFVKDMVGKDDLSNAIALNSAIFNSSRIVGPALAGLTLGAVGAGWCFLLNGLSYFAVIYGIFRMEMPKVTPPARHAAILADIREGLRYVRRAPSILALMLVVSISAVFAVPYTTLLPAYARDVMHVDAEGLGFLSTATGVGALAGALMMATLSYSRRRGVILSAGNLVYPAALLGLAFSTSYALSLLLLAVAGFAFMAQQSTANALVQSHAPDNLRARVMSIYMLASFAGMQPIGAIQAGSVAEHFGVSAGIGVGATIALVSSLLILWWLPRVRELQ
ncbi:MAG: MFS transporter [Chloroflexi bacterium]|nr:MFS transporter [Chloroflexota bacterium]